MMMMMMMLLMMLVICEVGEADVVEEVESVVGEIDDVVIDEDCGWYDA